MERNWIKSNENYVQHNVIEEQELSENVYIISSCDSFI